MLALLAATLCSAAGGAVGQPPSWRLAYATESPSRRGLDVYVAAVPDGKPRRIAGSDGRDDFSPAWSPDGKLIAYRLNPVRGDESDIMVVPAAGGTPRNLTRSPGVADWSPAWSPDGRTIAFFSMRAGGRDIWLMRPDGSGKRRLTGDGSLNEYPAWSPDGRTIAFQSTRRGEFDIYAMSSDGRRQRNLSRHPARDQWAAWSPDGRWIAFMSMRDGSEDIFVMRPDGSAVRNLTRTPGLDESHPAWSPSGELTFSRHGESGPIELWRIGVDGKRALRLSTTAEPVFAFDWA
jgi:TolB protein